MIPQFLFFFPLLSVAALLVLLMLPRHWERSISTVAIAAILANILFYLVFLYSWAVSGFVPVAQTSLTLFSSHSYTFAFDFFFDKTSAVFFGITCLTTLLIMMFSKYYMHRDLGYKRFYVTVMSFFIGLTCILFSGTLETLFVGWEFIGISSFLLIAFYRDRFLPARNALKIFTLYRIADAVLLCSLWYAHHLFEKNIHFSELATIVSEHGNQFFLLGLLFLFVALIKSAQYPFSYWLPRAMEGPTTSSAIFYGALSVHMGLFVLLRTFPLWEGSFELRAVVVACGVLTAFIATSITRVQSSIKTRIAYASVTQIGLMFVEVALGLHWLVLLHFTSNAFLRTYQLLISPSIVGYLIHDMFYHFALPPEKISNSFIGRVRASLYILSLKEWNMDTMFYLYVTKPMKFIGRVMNFLDKKISQVILAIVFLLVIGYIYYISLYTSQELSSVVLESVSFCAALLSIGLFIRAFSAKGNAHTTWNMIFLGQMCTALFLALVDSVDLNILALLMYGSGNVIAFLLGHICIRRLEKKGEDITLADFKGHMYEYPNVGNAFFFLCLAFMAFPITPAFLGQEILVSHIHMDHLMQIVLFALGYLLSGVSIIRLYAKLFFGPHKKTYHEIAYKSS